MHKMVGQVLSEHRLVKYPFIVTLMVFIPTWISMVLGLRILSCGLDPAGFPGITETLAVGGVLWFKNLLQADPCSVLPFVFPLSLWLKSEVCAKEVLLITSQFHLLYLNLVTKVFVILVVYVFIYYFFFFHRCMD